MIQRVCLPASLRPDVPRPSPQNIAAVVTLTMMRRRLSEKFLHWREFPFITGTLHTCRISVFW
ncbi:hypothetical protein HMPREF3293_03083 [Christensenella minuta]|uniref:Uncharacterized protein n=1 Tax=Christensenella minuta TaxID=626937 RepID=A0A136Q026_9FIRM|nr:hypothetical protein HMPREF3293_03083 [Christensenella minuta]